MSEALVRRPYEKPEIVRVDLIEDEIALATCKSLTPQTAVKGAALGGCSAKNCKADAIS